MVEGQGPPAPSTTPGGATGADTVTPMAVERQVGPYVAREEHLIQMEREGQISFRYVVNDGEPQNMIWLIGLKTIFSKQLPNMPREYIVRLVLDRRHRSVALLKADGTVIGGITYRAFHHTGLGEIAFCAVAAQEQVKGFGTRLMNYAKEFARTRDKLSFFLTYADNNAVGYFSKQGFTKEITTDKDKWTGYIKDYDGGTLMECLLHPRVCYTALPDTIRRQRADLEARIRGLCRNHVVQPGLQLFKGGRRSQIPIRDIPGVVEAGWTPEAQPKYKVVVREEAVEPGPEQLHRFMQQLLKELRKQEDVWPFLEAVSVEDAPDYYEVIKDPVDVSMIERRLASQTYYLTLEIFLADLRRMFSNCRIYNAAETIYYKIAVQLDGWLESYMHSHIIMESGPV